jgi:hypothetical protein
MRNLLFTVVILTSIPVHAGVVSNWWKGVCEKHLIADDPYDGEEQIAAWRSSMTEDDFIQTVLEAYIRSGAEHWQLRGKSRVIHRNLGRELRWISKTHPSSEIDDALESYSRFEATP